MPRAKVIGWTLIACGIAMRIGLPRVAPPNDRVHSAMYAFYTFVAFVFGLSFVYFGRWGIFVSKDGQTVSGAPHVRKGCISFAILAVVLLLFAITTYEPD